MAKNAKTTPVKATLTIGGETLPLGSTRRCPICDKPATPAGFPFCSKRCADIDLHHWLTGRYAIPVVEADQGLEGDETGED